MREATEGLARALDSYIVYLSSQNKMKAHHCSPTIAIADKTSVELLQANRAPSQHSRKLDDAISDKGLNEHLLVADFAPSDRQEKYRYVQEKNCVALVSCAHAPSEDQLLVHLAGTRACHFRSCSG